MYKVLIADSKYHINGRQKYNTDWNNEGFDVVCIAKTVTEAMEYMAKSDVDLIFTDINFTDLPVSELLSFVQSHCPCAKVVVVSECTDFKYVKQVYDYSVFDYIKQSEFTESVLCDVLKKFKKSENNIFAANSPANIKITENYIYRRKHIINVLTKNIEDKDLCNMLIVAVKIFNYSLFEHIHSTDDLSILVHNMINTIVQVINDPLPVLYLDNSNNIIICMEYDKSMPETAIMNSINSYVRRINFLVKKFFNMSLSWGISGLSTPEYSLNECHKEALTMLYNTPIAERKTRFDIPEFSTISLDEEKKVLSAIQTLDYDSIDRCLDGIFAERIHSNIPVHILTGELTAIANKLCSELDIDLSKSPDILIEENNPDNADTIAEQSLEWSKKLFHNIIRMHLEQTRPSRHSTYAKFVRSYIAEKYKEDISLKGIA